MEEKHLLGIDIGTQGTKAVLFDRRGTARASAFRKSHLFQPAPGAVEEDPERQVTSVYQCIRACLRDAGVARESVAAIGIDGQMAGILGVGDDGKHITPYDSWLDTRCAPYITMMQNQAGEEIICKTGGPASFNHGPKVLWWKHERPEVYNRIAAFVQPGGYAVMRICGMDASNAFIDKSYLHFSAFADNPRGCWDDALCHRFEVSISKLPRIVDSHCVVGGVTPAAARACGLKAGTPVIAGCGDTAASFLACGATQEGVCVDVAGTASVFAATTAQFKADTRFRTLGWGQSATTGLWHPYAYINGGGMNLEWFAREFMQSGKAPSQKTLERLNRLASDIAPCMEDPMFVPHLGGRMSPSEPKLRGSWAGLHWSHTAGHLYRATLEGVALEYCLYRDVLQSVNPELAIREVRVTGGGEKSDLWNQIKADALGVPLVQIDRHEGAPLGVALLAGYGVGLFKSLESAAAQWIHRGTVVRPARKLGEHYRSRLARYKRLLEALRDWADIETETA
ncbi:MAG: xylulokinase [Planctomycetota bacterium]